jgi:chromosome segregation ATPase
MEKKPDKMTTEFLFRLNEYGRRIRLLEERVDRIVSSLHSLEEEMKGIHSELKIGFERRDEKLKDLSEKLEGLQKDFSKLEERMNKLATKAEIKEIKNFIEILNTVTSNFVTKDELQRILEDFNNLNRK